MKNIIYLFLMSLGLVLSANVFASSHHEKTYFYVNNNSDVAVSIGVGDNPQLAAGKSAKYELKKTYKNMCFSWLYNGVDYVGNVVKCTIPVGVTVNINGNCGTVKSVGINEYVCSTGEQNPQISNNVTCYTSPDC